MYVTAFGEVLHILMVDLGRPAKWISKRGDGTLENTLDTLEKDSKHY